MKKLFKWVAIIFAILFLIGLFFGEDNGNNSTGSNNEVSQEEVESLQQFEAQDLVDAYEANAVAADNQFKGKRFRVLGNVSDIRTDLFDNAVVELKTNNEFMSPQFKLKDSEKSKAGNLKKGMVINLVCTGAGDIAKVPMNDDCVF